ncbi:protein of unknown function [Kyrpidia spormannii]|uniref:Uncharacterized protein n=2 Tax=Kyrpidia spormannii TaxID=2055160 RepID=A0ACA8ZCN1_9BACL|nr:protein of unknown function [Kyrpidia spormannii]CAB3394803.1 protein of unknown function [Kyrpidia spormannii]
MLVLTVLEPDVKPVILVLYINEHLVFFLKKESDHHDPGVDDPQRA